MPTVSAQFACATPVPNPAPDRRWARPGRLNAAALLLLCTVWAAAAQPDADLGAQTAAAKSVINISGHAESQPYLWLKQDEPVGVALTLAQQIFTQLDLTTQFNPAPWKRTLRNLETGDIDVIVALYWNQKRAQVFHYSIAFAENPLAVFVHVNSKLALTNPRELAFYRGISLLGESFGEEFDKFSEANLNILRVDSLQQMFRMLAAGRVDYALYAKYPALVQLQKMALLNDIKQLPLALPSQGVHMAFSKKSPYVHLLPAVNDAIRRMTDSGEITALLNAQMQAAAEAD